MQEPLKDHSATDNTNIPSSVRLELNDIMTSAQLPQQVPMSAHHSIHNHQSEHWMDILRFPVSIVPSILVLLIFFSVWATLVCVFALVPSVNFLSVLPPYNPEYTTVVGVVLSLLLATTPGQEAAQQSALKLLTGFAMAVKHRLREEYHPVYPDLAPHIDHMPHILSDTESRHVLPPITKNIPLDILSHIQAYLQSRNQTAPPICNAINALVEQFTQLERIANTPLPAAYAITLRQVLLLYLIAIPFQLVPALQWFTIPVTFIAAFVMLGVFEISAKIENPFGYYLHDLPVDSYCHDIQRMLEHTAAFERVSESDLKWGKTFGIHESNVHVHHGGIENSSVHLDKKDDATIKTRRTLFSRV
ncbi:UNVERIFIED_CONTAM: hypothetical protein HDU68_006839 [Siphonaria sp. JEL0065]|nr:hypothetical protein HDU68_006839 [Siphonaria sp. JEL0065]